jgi:hypothetical protein
MDAVHRFRSMSSTDFDVIQKVDAMRRTERTACPGFGGRLRPDYALPRKYPRGFHYAFQHLGGRLSPEVPLTTPMPLCDSLIVFSAHSD